MSLGLLIEQCYCRMESTCKWVTIIFNYTCSVTVWHIRASSACFLFFQFLNINLPSYCTRVHFTTPSPQSLPWLLYKLFFHCNFVFNLSKFLIVLSDTCMPCILYSQARVMDAKPSLAPRALCCHTKHCSCRTMAIGTQLAHSLKLFA